MAYFILGNELNKKEKIILNNLSKKVSIKIVSDPHNLNKNDILFMKNPIYTNHIFTIKRYKNIFAVVKYFFSDKNCREKLSLINNICYGIDTIVISCGSSINNIDYNFLREKQKEYIIISVKYIINKLLENNIQIDFAITSDFKTSKNFEYNYINTNDYITFNLSRLSDVTSEYFKKYDFILSPKIKVKTKNKENYWEKTFKTIIETNSLDIIKLSENKIKDNILFFNLAHIMLECVLPLAIHIGSNKIYTIGWDGPSKKGMEYFSEINGEIKKLKAYGRKGKMILHGRQEYKYIKEINKVFIKNNIFLYKLSIESPINLPYSDLLISHN